MSVLFNLFCVFDLLGLQIKFIHAAPSWQKLVFHKQHIHVLFVNNVPTDAENEMKLLYFVI